ncbi:MAG: Ig-like domain-containing protein [Bacteroidetes bacterium]|nr:Ig-like domain-containing protein [Bacteroidota bacterium]
MKKILMGLALILFGVTSRAQNGLENIVVEKYYVSNAADAAGSTGVLPAGSVTYRIWADMLPGYNFQALYGVAGHTLTVQTTTSFFNNEDYGGTTPTVSTTNIRKNSALLDSYFSVGGAATGRVAVFKSEDTDGSPGNAQSILQNNDASTTGAINIGATTSLLAQDGMIVGSPVAVTYVGINNTGNGDLGVLDGVSQVGGLFTTTNGSVAALGGAVGPTAANRVLVGQFTTNGIFSFTLNAQIGTPGGGTQQFVASNPVGAEILLASLTGTFGAPNSLPTVSITSPANGASFLTGAVVSIAANASDADGTISQVQFKVDGVSVGIDNTSPYTASYTAVNGSHCITAIATDNSGGTTTTSCVTISVAGDPLPTCVITAPANGANYAAGATVNISATATDNGSVVSVEFFVDGVSLSIDNTSPYDAVYTAVSGAHTITAKATDNLGGQTTSAGVNISVGANTPPTVSITSPSNGASFFFPNSVSLAATANDVDGTINYVQFFVNGVAIGTDASAPFTLNWPSVIGSAVITARAVDNLGAQTFSSAVNITIIDPNAAPYKITNISSTCVGGLFCLPVTAVAAVANVIGYDVVLHYDKTKVLPTGVVTVYSNLITPSYVDVATSTDTAAGNMLISLFFNATAPPAARFTGTGNLFCTEFTKLGSFAAIDTAAFSIISLQESYFTGVSTKLVDAGKYTSFKDTAFKATISFWLDNSPIKYNSAVPTQYLITNIYGNSASCNSRSTTAVQPDLAGAFSYSLNNGVDVEITRNILPGTSMQPVVNGFDAFLTRKVLINDISFLPSAYQVCAMDVNIDGVVSAGDLSQINQRAVLLIPEFKQAWNYDTAGNSNGQPSKDWSFIDVTTLNSNPAFQISATYPAWNTTGYNKAHVPPVPFCLSVPVINGSTCPIINQESYKSVLLGDVNGNFATVGSGGLYRENHSNRVIFDLSKAVVANGYIDVPVSVAGDITVNALDFAMQFNENNLSFNSIADHTGYMQSLSNFNATDRTLRFTSNSLQNYDLGKSLVSVRFASASGSISESDLSNIEAYLNGEEVSADVISRNGHSSIANENSVSIYPNPATSMLNVIAAEDATVEMMDMNGRQVVIQTTVSAIEKKEINRGNLSSGIYMMKIYNSNFVTIQKVVINK